MKVYLCLPDLEEKDRARKYILDLDLVKMKATRERGLGVGRESSARLNSLPDNFPGDFPSIHQGQHGTKESMGAQACELAGRMQIMFQEFRIL